MKTSFAICSIFSFNSKIVWFARTMAFGNLVSASPKGKWAKKVEDAIVPIGNARNETNERPRLVIDGRVQGVW